MEFTTFPGRLRWTFRYPRDRVSQQSGVSCKRFRRQRRSGVSGLNHPCRKKKFETEAPSGTTAIHFSGKSEAALASAVLRDGTVSARMGLCCSISTLSRHRGPFGGPGWVAYTPPWPHGQEGKRSALLFCATVYHSSGSPDAPQKHRENQPPSRRHLKGRYGVVQHTV